MNRSLRVFVACAVGALIGTLVTLQLNSYFWWIGLFVGGAIGYLSYDPRQVLAAIKTAWHEVINYRPDKERMFNTVWSVLLIGSAVASLIWVFVVISVGTTRLGWISGFGTQLGLLPLLLVSYSTLFYCALCWLGTVNMWLNEDDEGRALRNIFGHADRKVLYRLNPVAVSIYWPVGITSFIIWVLWNYTPTAVRIALKFTKTVFIAIHSKERLLCEVDAAIGVVVGFYFGNPIAGALIGGTIGVLNFRIVSIRILHLSFEKG